MKGRYVMGTFLNVRIKGNNTVHLTKIFYDEVQTLEDFLSIYKPGSEISQINQAAGIAPVVVSNDTFEIVQKAKHYAEVSSGAFDPTLQSKGFTHIITDPLKQTIYLEKPAMTLDLGGIGKGFALDKALAQVIRQGSPQSVAADFGGQLLFWHWRGSFGPETIVIEDPEQKGKVLSTFQINSNCSISTSSNAERPNHLRDPRTGEPAVGNSITVVAPTGVEAEALSTALFVQNPLERIALLEKSPGVKSFP